MKKKGFISISIIYSFFLVFLLLLVLTLSAYVTNRYSFNIFTKDEKKAHARRTEVAQNNKKVSSLTAEADNRYFTSIYESVEGQYVPYYFYSNNPVCLSCNDKKKVCTEPQNDGCNEEIYVDDIIVIFGSKSESSHNKLKLTSSADGDLSQIGKAIRNISVNCINKYSEKTIGTNKINKNVLILLPSLNTKYISWEDYVKKTCETETDNCKNNAGYKDLFKNGTDDQKIPEIIKQMVDQINASYKNGANVVRLRNNTKVTYIGYEQGANGILSAMSKDTAAPSEEVNKIPRYYRVANTTIQCNTTDCSRLNPTNLEKKASTTEIYYLNDAGIPTAFDKLYTEMKTKLTGMNSSFKGQYGGDEEDYITDVLQKTLCPGL